MESESKMRFEEEDNEKLRTQNKELQQELEAMKVCVVYIHQLYSIMRSYYFCHARGLCKCKFLGCHGEPGMCLRFVVKIGDGDL